MYAAMYGHPVAIGRRYGQSQQEARPPLMQRGQIIRYSATNRISACLIRPWAGQPGNLSAQSPAAYWPPPRIDRMHPLPAPLESLF